ARCSTPRPSRKEFPPEVQSRFAPLARPGGLHHRLRVLGIRLARPDAVGSCGKERNLVVARRVADGLSNDTCPGIRYVNRRMCQSAAGSVRYRADDRRKHLVASARSWRIEAP